MKIVYFCHSVISDWTNENAHFFRGLARSLAGSGHEVRLYESINNWSLCNLLRQEGPGVVDEFRTSYPDLQPVLYRDDQLDLAAVVQYADLVIVHEWNDPELFIRLSALRQEFSFCLLFQDTCHRSLDCAGVPADHDLSGFDGILVFSNRLKVAYRRLWPAVPVLVWQEAADISLFRPVKPSAYEGELVWIGNWGNGERSQDLFRWLAEPVAQLGIKATVYGPSSSYSDTVKRGLALAGIRYGGWISGFRIPEIFSRYLFTFHIPYSSCIHQNEAGVSMQPFAAMACGIPLIAAQWHDTEPVFTAGHDYLAVKDQEEMMGYMQRLRKDAAFRQELARQGLATIRERHTCRHRALQLLTWVGTLSATESRVVYSTV